MRTRTLLSAALLPLLVAVGALAGDKKAWIDPAKAAEEAPGFAVQGEYRGQKANSERTIAAQIIGLGGDRFRLIAYRGGLPGAGSAKREHQAKGTRKNGRVVFRAGGQEVAVWENGRLTAREDGRTIGTLKKIHRESPTLGKKPPEEAVVLFDGTKETLKKHWKKGSMTGGGLLKQGAMTKTKFGDHQLHVEFLLPYRPKARGQGRGNSGLYLQGRYEVQMLDSFGLAGKHNECGGIYETRDPNVNMCYPPLRWQTYDVEFTAAEFDENGEKTAPATMTVRHNGVMIHENVEVPGPTRAAPIKNEKGPGPVYLQNHGNPVRYRNIWAVPGE